MTAAASAWLNSHLDRMTGEGALVWIAVIAALAVTVSYGLYELGAFVRKRLGTWHAHRRAQPWPIPFVEPRDTAGDVALVVTLAFCALIAAILWSVK